MPVDTATGEVIDDMMPVDAIEVLDRHRQELGDIDALAASIRYSGLLHPVVVTREGRLVAGQRRLEAVRQLGWAEVPVRIAWSVDSARDLLLAERDENTCRKPMTASELYALGKALEEMERPKARERQGGSGRFGSDGSGSVDPKPSESTNEVVGDSLGMSEAQWKRLKHLGDRAVNGDADAAAALEEVDRGDASIAGAYRKLREYDKQPVEQKRRNLSPAARTEQIRPLAAQGYRASQIAEEIGISEEYVRRLARDGGITLPDAHLGKTRALNPTRIVGETVNALEGVVLGIGLLGNEELVQLDRAQVADWATSLSHSLRSLNRFAKQLKEMARD